MGSRGTPPCLASMNIFLVCPKTEIVSFWCHTLNCRREEFFVSSFLGADYMGIFKLGWIFNLVQRVEISSRLNRKLLFKMTLQLHVKISIWHTELKFQLGLANPKWDFNPGWKFQISHIIDIFSNPGWKFDTTHARVPCLFFLKNKDGDFTSTFQMDRWQTYLSYRVFTRIQRFHGIQKFRLKRWQSQIIWKYEKKSIQIYLI